MKYLISESQAHSIQDKLLDMVKNEGWDYASDMVGGPDNLLSILGKTKENVVNLILSYFKNLHLERRGGSVILVDGGTSLIETSSWGFNTKVLNNGFERRLDKNLFRLYVEYRRDIVRKLISLFPDLYSDEIDVYENSGFYHKYDTFFMNT